MPESPTALAEALRSTGYLADEGLATATYLALRAIDSKVAVLLMSGHTMNEQVQEIYLGVKSGASGPTASSQP